MPTEPTWIWRLLTVHQANRASVTLVWSDRAVKQLILIHRSGRPPAEDARFAPHWVRQTFSPSQTILIAPSRPMAISGLCEADGARFMTTDSSGLIL